MSTKHPIAQMIELDWEQVVKALFASLGIEKGFWHLGVQVHFGATTGGWGEPEKAIALPTGLIGMKGIGLSPAPGPGPMVFDASVLGTKPAVSKAPVKPSARPVAKKAKVAARG
jgi:hypothetical protein